MGGCGWLPGDICGIAGLDKNLWILVAGKSFMVEERRVSHVGLGNTQLWTI